MVLIKFCSCVLFTYYLLGVRARVCAMKLVIRKERRRKKPDRWPETRKTIVNLSGLLSHAFTTCPRLYSFNRVILFANWQIFVLFRTLFVRSLSLNGRKCVCWCCYCWYCYRSRSRQQAHTHKMHAILSIFVVFSAISFAQTLSFVDVNTCIFVVSCCRNWATFCFMWCYHYADNNLFRYTHYTFTYKFESTLYR